MAGRLTRIRKYLGRILLGSSAIGYRDNLTEHQPGGGYSLSGSRVTPYTALGLPAVWSSVGIISGHMGIIPMEYRRRLPGDRSEQVKDSPIHRLLNVEPNELMTAYAFKSTMMVHALLTGTGRAVILRDSLGRPSELILMWPETVYTVMQDGEKWHVVHFDKRYLSGELPYNLAPGQSGGAQTALYKIPDRDVLSIYGLSWNGLWGLSLVDLAKNVFGLDLSGIQTAATMFRNNGQPSLILEAPEGAIPTEREGKAFLQEFRSAHEGIDNTARTGLLREGVTARPIPLNSADAQYLESRKFSRDDIALLLGTEYLMGESSAVYKDLQERQAAYVVNTLAKWLENWEQQVTQKMMDPLSVQSDSHFVRANPAQLLKGSPNSLATYTSSLRNQGALNGNEVREIHGINPSDDPALETYTAPAVTTPEDTEQDTETPEEDPNEPTQKAVRYIFRNLIKTERKRVLDLAGKPDMSGKLSRFYETHQAVMKDACRQVGIPLVMARAHCEESKEAIQEAVEASEPGTVADSLDCLTLNWESRAEGFVQC